MATKEQIQNQLDVANATIRDNQTALATSNRRGNIATGAAFAFATSTALLGGTLLVDASRPQAIVINGNMPSLGSRSGNIDVNAPGTPNSEKIGPLDINPIGRDAWSGNILNWSPIREATGNVIGAVMTPEPHGLNSVVSTTDSTVGQAYWDAIVEGEHQAIGLVFAPGVTVPVRGISEYPVLPGQTSENATKIAFDGQVNLEHQTQPNVCTLEITQGMQAVAGNEQTVAVDQWQAEKLTPQQAAERFGEKGTWSGNEENWSNTPDGYGTILAVNPDGSNSIVKMTGAVGQAYWDAIVAGEHQAIAGTLGVGVIAPVRGVTVYAGVPAGMEQQAALNAFGKAVKLEIETQPGVYVVLVSKSDCPAAEQNGTSSVPSGTTEVQPSATPATTNGHPSWENNIYAKVKNSRLSQMSDGGLKIASGNAISVTLNAGEKMTYWNGQKVIDAVGPRTVNGVYEASIYQQ